MRSQGWKTSIGCGVTPLRPFECKAIEILVAGIIPVETLGEIFEESAVADYEYTGCGYFLKLTHPELPSKVCTCHEPKVRGEANGILSGFIVYLGDGELVLECYTLGEIDVPPTYRDQDVQVSAT